MAVKKASKHVKSVHPTEPDIDKPHQPATRAGMRISRCVHWLALMSGGGLLQAPLNFRDYTFRMRTN